MDNTNVLWQCVETQTRGKSLASVFLPPKNATRVKRKDRIILSSLLWYLTIFQLSNILAIHHFTVINFSFSNNCLSTQRASVLLFIMIHDAKVLAISVHVFPQFLNFSLFQILVCSFNPSFPIHLEFSFVMTIEMSTDVLEGFDLFCYLQSNS